MQPPLLLTWIRIIDLSADADVATKRWDLAMKVSANLTRVQILSILRVFLFAPADETEIKSLSLQLIGLDPNFTPSPEYVRLMAGLAILAALEERTQEADAFALGAIAADFPVGRCKPVQQAIRDALADYLLNEGNRLRPSDFCTDDDKDAFATEVQKVVETEGEDEADDEETKTQYLEFAQNLQTRFGTQIKRLAEESSVLWWIIGEHSPTLNQVTKEFEESEYSLIVAAEAAERTLVLPPSPSIHALLTRALAPCKKPKSKRYSVKDIVVAADEGWKSKFAAAHTLKDCSDLVPLLTAVSKSEDVGNTGDLARAVSKVCPGFDVDAAITPSQAAHQFYNELVFFKSLSQLG